MKIKKARLERVIVDVVRESGQSYIPKIQYIPTFNELLNNLNNTAIFCITEKQSVASLKKVTTKENITIIIGPEGGFTLEEIDLASTYKDVITLNLELPVMRVETAAVAILAGVKFLQFK